MKRSVLALLVLAVAGCPDPTAPEHRVSTVPAAPAPTAKWHRTAWSNEGVRLGDARLVLMAGERYRVDASGGITAATVSSPAPLRGLLLIPAPSGSKVVGYSEDAVYRFDDPLGAGIFIAGTSTIRDTGTAPGVIRLYADDQWHSIDLEGTPISFGPLLATWTEFIDMERGMTWVPYAGLLVTRDGGKTWRGVASSAMPPEATRRQGPRDEHSARDGVLRMENAVIDANDASVRRAAREREPDLVRWLRKTRASPIEAVAKGGVQTSPGEAVVIGGGLRMVVDIATGMPRAFKPVPERTELDMFDRRTVWRGATFGADRLYFNDPDVTDEDTVTGALQLHSRPRFVLHERAGSEDLTLLPALAPYAQVVVSASGGILFTSGCSGAPSSGVVEMCARQPDGTWKTLLAPIGRHSSPAADGGYLLARLDGNNLVVERELPTGGRVRWEAAHIQDAVSVGYLNEIDPTTVQAFVRGEYIGCKATYCLASVRLTQGKPPSVTTFEWSDRLDSFGSKLAFINDEGLHVSEDGGAHFRTENLPSYFRVGTTSVSEMGIDVDGEGFRLGWGAQAPIDAPPEPRPPVTLQRSSQPWLMHCDRSEGGAARPAPMLSEEAAAVVSATNDSIYGSGALGRMDIIETKTGSRVSVQWIDGLEVPAKVRSATVEVKDKIRVLSSFSAVANKDKALFLVEIAGASYAARASGTKLEWVQFGAEQHLDGPAALAADGAAAWVVHDEVWYWPSAGKPRLAAMTAGTLSAMAAPHEGSLSLFSMSKHDVATRTIRLEGPAVRVDHEGWVPAPFRFDTVATLPACGKSAPAKRLVLLSPSDGNLEATGWSEDDAFDDGQPGTFALRFDDRTACVEAVEMKLVAFMRWSSMTGRSEGGTSSRATDVADFSCSIARR